MIKKQKNDTRLKTKRESYTLLIRVQKVQHGGSQDSVSHKTENESMRINYATLG